MTTERFQIIGEIGRGSRSVVYRARDVLLDREVALKVYARSSHTAPIREHFLGEARALAAVEHPHVVSLWGIEERDDELRIALALVEGEPLTAARRPLSARRIAEIGRDLCSALGSLHARGLLHRDLRPENVMLRPDGSAVLLDFGVERSLPHPEAVTDFDEFDAPELRAGDAFTAATDVYALARLMLWLGGGRLPEPLASVVARATRAEIAERAPDPETLSIELVPCLAVRPARPYRLLAAGVAVAAGLALGAAQWIPGDGGDSPAPRAETDVDAGDGWLVRGEGLQIRFAELVRENLPRGKKRQGSYNQPSEVIADLEILKRSLTEAGAKRLSNLYVRPIIRFLDTFGFHMAALGYAIAGLVFTVVIWLIWHAHLWRRTAPANA